jgi:hypothetical protein
MDGTPSRPVRRCDRHRPSRRRRSGHLRDSNRSRQGLQVIHGSTRWTKNAKQTPSNSRQQHRPSLSTWPVSFAWKSRIACFSQRGPDPYLCRAGDHARGQIWFSDSTTIKFDDSFVWAGRRDTGSENQKTHVRTLTIRSGALAPVGCNPSTNARSAVPQ